MAPSFPWIAALGTGIAWVSSREASGWRSGSCVSRGCERPAMCCLGIRSTTSRSASSELAQRFVTSSGFVSRSRSVCDGRSSFCPTHFVTHPLHVQRAVLSHELIHVQRRDWMWLVVEEVVRAVFWFHPGVWWLISRVQLAREEVVDELAMLATGTRRGTSRRSRLLPTKRLSCRRPRLRGGGTCSGECG